MRKGILASLAVAGTVAVMALFNTATSTSESTSFLQTNELETAFNNFIAKYGRSFGTKQEYHHRLGVFMKNYKKIVAHNMNNSEEEGYFMSLNQFSDMTADEFKQHTGRLSKLDQGENK